MVAAGGAGAPPFDPATMNEVRSIQTNWGVWKIFGGGAIAMNRLAGKIAIITGSTLAREARGRHSRHL